MPASYTVAQIAVSAAAYSFDTEFSYLVPDELCALIKPGVRVLVPFGKGNKRVIGFVLRLLHFDDRPERVKPVLRLIDEQPMFRTF